MKTLNTLVVFCHNDCNPGNILKLENTNKLMLIDYEYGSYNYRGFDIANTFCEMMFDYNCDEAPYFRAEPDKFPSKYMQDEFVEAYIEKFKEINPGMVADDASLIDKEKLLYEVNNFVLVSHLFWTIFCITKSETSSNNFDYLVSSGYLISQCIN